MNDTFSDQLKYLSQRFKQLTLPWQICWVCVSVVIAVSLYITCKFWLDTPDSWDRILILAGCFWCWLKVLPNIQTLPNIQNLWIGIPFLLLACVTITPIWYCYNQVGTRPILIWLVYLSSLLAICGIIFAQLGWRYLLAVKFALFFALLAIPIPARINEPLQAFLQNITTTIAHQAISLIGIPVVRNGFVLSLPNGQLGVVEACSGIRSLTALTAIAVLMAFIKGFGFLRGGLMLVLSIPVIILVNSFRVFLTGMIQELIGPKWIEGWPHEVLGYSMIFLGLGMIWLISEVIIHYSKRFETSQPATHNTQATAAQANSAQTNAGAWVAAVLLCLTVAGGIFALSQPSIVKSALTSESSQIESVSMKIGNWNGVEIPVPQSMRNQLQDDKIFNRIYRDKFGNEITLWVVYWSSTKSVKGYHHPDICMPNSGNVVIERKILELVSGKDRRVPVTAFEFEKGKVGSFLYYWTQEGRNFWTDEDEKDSYKMSYPFLWIKKRLGKRDQDSIDDRITILMGTSFFTRKEGAKESINEFAKLFIDEFYDKINWADPQRNTVPKAGEKAKN